MGGLVGLNVKGNKVTQRTLTSNLQISQLPVEPMQNLCMYSSYDLVFVKELACDACMAMMNNGQQVACFRSWSGQDVVLG